MNVRVVRLKGFSRGQAEEYGEAPVTLGTSTSCHIRFDPTWHKTVSAQHARLERRGVDWIVVDAGSPAGTWIRGQRIVRPELIDGAVEVELGRGGPRVSVEPVSAPSEVSAPQSSVRAPSASPAVYAPAGASGVPRRQPSRNLPLIAGAAVTVVLVIAGLAWWLAGDRPAAEKRTTAAPLPPLMEDGAREPGRRESEAGDEEDAEITEEVAAAPAAGSASTKPAASGASLSEEERAVVARHKSQPMYRGLRQYWTESNTRSPYTRSFLENEDAWFAGVFSYVRSAGADRFSVPGLFISEYFGPGTLLPGTPVTPDTLVAELKPGIMGGGSDGASRTVAVGGPRARGFTVAPKALDSLKAQFAVKTKAAAGTRPKAWAVLVGISDFEFISDLTSCRNDVTAIAKVLTTQGIFEPGQIRLLTDARRGTPSYASKANVMSALNETLRDAAESDVVFICISSHGGYDKRRKDSHFYLADSQGVSPEETSEREYNDAVKSVIYGQEFEALLGKAKARNIVLAFDACHAGGLAALGNRQFLAPKGKPARVSHQFGVVPESFYDRIGESRGHTVIRASRADQTTPDLAYLGLGQSMLTLVLLQGLTGDADANRDGMVTLGELRVFTTTAIPKISRNAAAAGEDQSDNGGPLEPTFTSGAFGEAGDLPLTVVAQP